MDQYFFMNYTVYLYTFLNKVSNIYNDGLYFFLVFIGIYHVMKRFDE